MGRGRAFPGIGAAHLGVTSGDVATPEVIWSCRARCGSPGSGRGAAAARKETVNCRVPTGVLGHVGLLIDSAVTATRWRLWSLCCTGWGHAVLRPQTQGWSRLHGMPSGCTSDLLYLHWKLQPLLPLKLRPAASPPTLLNTVLMVKGECQGTPLFVKDHLWREPGSQ